MAAQYGFTCAPKRRAQAAALAASAATMRESLRSMLEVERAREAAAAAAAAAEASEASGQSAVCQTAGVEIDWPYCFPLQVHLRRRASGALGSEVRRRRQSTPTYDVSLVKH